MRTTTLLAAAAALAISAAFSGAELAYAQQLGAESNALGSGGAAVGTEDAAADEGMPPEGPRAVAPAALGECVTNRTSFRTETNFVGTLSLDFVLMPNTHFPVTTSGGCLIVDFAGEVRSLDLETRMFIRAFIVGIGEAQPPVARLGRSIAVEFFETRSMRFVFPNVPAGQHVVRLQFSSETGTEVRAGPRILTVQYRK